MYCYKVKFWDCSSTAQEEGLVAAATMKEAMEYLEDRFGARDIIKLKLCLVDSESVDEHIMPFSEFDCNFSTFVQEEIF